MIIPCRNEERYIQACLDSVLTGDYPSDHLEVFVVDGMSNDNTRKIVEQYRGKFPNVVLLDNPHITAPCALNIGIEKASGEYIIRLDAHGIYPKNYIKTLVGWHKKLDAENIGVAIKTETQSSSSKAQAIRKVLSHPLGVGNSLFRTGAKKLREVDTVPFGCYKKEVFAKYGLFDERLARNQDIELNKRIIRGGGKIYLVPDVTCTYYARDNYIDLARNNFNNGYWNILTAYYTRSFSSLSLRHFVPLLFLLAIILPLPLVFADYRCAGISLLTLMFHLAFVMYVSLKLSDVATRLIDVIFAFYTLHISYGVGSLAGLAKVTHLRLIGK